VTGPVWDGHGDDPWLPARLAAIHDITKGEQAVYTQFWAILSGWLVKVARSVLSAVRPDPTAVFAHAPTWNRQMLAFANGSIKEVLGQSYKNLLGAGYRFDSRPAATAHLAQVVNRMVNTPDEVFGLIAAQLAEGSNLGEGVPKLAARVEDVLSTTATARWPNRAVTVARTETISALNAGRVDSFQAVAEELSPDELGAGFEQMWLATEDKRTRKTHREADGQRVALGAPFTVGGHDLAYPGDPDGPAREVIQCRCTTLLVRTNETVDMSNRQFRDH